MRLSRNTSWQRGGAWRQFQALFSNRSAAPLMAVPPSVSLADLEPGQCHGDGQMQPTLDSIDPTPGLSANGMAHRKPVPSPPRVRCSEADSGKVPTQACYVWSLPGSLPRPLQTELAPSLGILIRCKESQTTPSITKRGLLVTCLGNRTRDIQGVEDLISIQGLVCWGFQVTGQVRLGWGGIPRPMTARGPRSGKTKPQVR